MRSDTQTLIGIIREGVQAWRKREDWSRETVCAVLIEKFTLLGGTRITGLVFDPPTRDAYDRQRISAERIYRWLDDESKDTNLLPANFIPFLLAALPVDLRIEAVDRVLQLSNLTVRVRNASEDGCLIQAVQDMAKENGEAINAVLNLIDGATEDELRAAQREVTEADRANRHALKLIEALLPHGQ
ncbi:hypothetical protein [Methylobacillus flagellatus]|uniref:hypothetical protein n=1 Tax=Methylobacillus flagellatus TaxID=405 RepID=UPI0010F537BE|nr:hypothetical protein [Methylobacillus flagellatus]